VTIQALALLTLASSCTIPLRFIVVNTTPDELAITLRLASSQAMRCQPPRWKNYTPASHVNRWFREPERRPALDVRFDEADCSVRGTIPAHTALELEYSSAYDADRPELSEAEISLQGSAGRITLQGAQVRRHLEESSSRFILTYGAS
jgi:hypothetical protein